MNLMTLFEEWCWNPASVYQCWIESQRHNFGWPGREGLSIALPSKGGQSKLVHIRLSHPGVGREGSYSVKATGMISSWTFFWMVGGEVTGSQHHQPSGSSQSGVYVLVGSILPLGGCFCTCKTVQKIKLRILSIVLGEEIKVPDFV